MNFKKIALFCILTFFLTSTSFVFATEKKQQSKEISQENNIKIVTTIFPEYDWVKNVLGENPSNIELALLINNGTDLHSYQPTVKDSIKISDADLFIYVGGESDEWVKDTLKASKMKKKNSKEQISISLIDILGDRAKTEEYIEGMQEKNNKNDEDEFDEHVWLSLKNACIFVDAITEALCKLDFQNTSVYTKNALLYKEQIIQLDGEYLNCVVNAKKKTLVFADRFPFRYMTDDYGLKYYAAFKGCSAETEASFKTVIFLADKINDEKLNCVCKIENSDGKIAKTVVQSVKKQNVKICTLDSMQSVSKFDIENGTTYLSIMKENLKILQDALEYGNF